MAGNGGLDGWTAESMVKTSKKKKKRIIDDGDETRP